MGNPRVNLLVPAVTLDAVTRGKGTPEPARATAAVVGARGVVAEVTNSSGGSLDFRVQDPGTTPAGNAAANGYTTITVANGATAMVYIGPNNVDDDSLCDIGASTTNAGFTMRLYRY